MAGIGGLPTEPIQLIIAKPEPDSESLARLSRVSKYFAEVTRNHLYRSTTITGNGHAQITRLMRTLFSRPHLLNAIKCLDLTVSFEDGDTNTCVYEDSQDRTDISDPRSSPNGLDLLPHIQQ